ncbi:MAG: trigger factor [Chloroflexi bacterium]|nr:trigger factor [Chloroflexota bacterium]
MQVTVSPAPKSTVVVDIELPADRLDRAIATATRRLAARTRVPGFRPGKAPRFMLERVLGPGAVVDEAVEDLVDVAWREAMVSEGIVPIAPPQVELVTAEEGKPLVFKATVAVRPEIALGDYRNFPFKPEIEKVDSEKVARVIEELRDQQATLVPVEDRGAAAGDWAVIGFSGTRDGVAVEGGSAERMPLVLGQERLIPGFEGHLLGLRPGDETEFDITFPDDYPEESLRGAPVHFSATLRELRAKVLPEATDEWAQSLGDFADLAALQTDVRHRLERSALDRARHHFADRIIDYSVKNASADLPDILVDEEIEVMRDELRSSLARQGMTEEAYLAAAGKAEADLVTELRPAAELRAKTLIVLGRIAEEEGVEVTEAEVNAEAESAKARYASQPKLVAYFDTDRARMGIRSTLRRSRVVEKIIDEWLAAHPDHPALPHLEEGEPDRVAAPAEMAADAASSEADAVSEAAAEAG